MKDVNDFDMEILKSELEEQLLILNLEDGYKRLVLEKVEFYVGYEIEFTICDERPYEFKVKIYDDNGEELYLTRSNGDNIEKIIYDYIQNQFKIAEMRD